MHKTLHVLALSATLGATSLFASSGFYALTGTPDHPLEEIAYTTVPNFEVNPHGYVKAEGDHYVTGWKVEPGTGESFNNWSTDSESLGLVRLKDSTQPGTTTNFVNAQFFFPESDDIGETHSHQWGVFDYHGVIHALNATFTKTAAMSYSLSFAENIRLGGPGGDLINAANPLWLNFNADNKLMDVSGSTAPTQLFIGEGSDYSDEVVFTLDLGITSGHETQLTAAAAFSVGYTEQNGSGTLKAVSAYVDGNADLHTVYANGSEAVTHQLAHMTVGTNPGESVVRAPLTEAEQTAINTALGN